MESRRMRRFQRYIDFLSYFNMIAKGNPIFVYIDVFNTHNSSYIIYNTEFITNSKKEFNSDTGKFSKI